MANSMQWHEVYQQALNETFYAYEGKAPDKQEFLDTFTEFYDELMAENYIMSYPYSPPTSRRAAINRATVVYTDDVAPRKS